jgi:hypothetical protein
MNYEIDKCKKTDYDGVDVAADDAAADGAAAASAANAAAAADDHAADDDDHDNRKYDVINNLNVGNAAEQGIINLQYKLLVSGYKCAKVGGVVVYATCSLREGQNEEVVRKLLEEFKGRVVVERIEGLEEAPCEEGSLKGSLRFLPALGEDDGCFRGSGFFVCRLRKIECKEVEVVGGVSHDCKV